MNKRRLIHDLLAKVLELDSVAVAIQVEDGGSIATNNNRFDSPFAVRGLDDFIQCGLDGSNMVHHFKIIHGLPINRAQCQNPPVREGADYMLFYTFISFLGNMAIRRTNYFDRLYGQRWQKTVHFFVDVLGVKRRLFLLHFRIWLFIG